MRRIAELRLEDVIIDHVGDVEPADCGAVNVGDALPAIQAAHDCAVAAINSMTPFRVDIHDTTCAEVERITAIVGVFENAGTPAYEFLTIASAPGNSGPNTSTYVCSSLVDFTPCTESDLRNYLCLRCETTPLGEACSP